MKCSLRTLQRNLADGRARLRERLIRRGLAPAVLASAVLSAEGLRAHVAPTLMERTIDLASSPATVPAAVRSLLISTSSVRGLTMKMILCGLLAAGGLAIALNDRQSVVACPHPPRPPRTDLVLAPAPKEKPSNDPLADKVREAQKKAIDYLKGQQRDQGGGIWNWENDTLQLLQPGGTSALAMLALLDSGLKVDDRVVARGLKYLRTVQPQHTYVVGLQTQVFCKLNRKEDVKLIRRNVQWLENAAAWKGKQLLGWSYMQKPGGRADNSNTRYAIAALWAADKAGVKVTNASFWRAVLDLYTRTQNADGGWSYQSGGPKSSHTMTLSGLLCMSASKGIVGKVGKPAQAALTKGEAWVANAFTLENKPHTFYNFDVIAAYGRSIDSKFIGNNKNKHEWYKEGAEWLLENQKPGGEWQIRSAIDDFPVVSTSFALRFLASRPK